jgi:hypothetical protein
MGKDELLRGVAQALRLDSVRLQRPSSPKGGNVLADRREYQRTDTMVAYDVRSETHERPQGRAEGGLTEGGSVVHGNESGIIGKPGR